MPILLRAEPSDYAPNVLCPGDPRRAQYIAETFFDEGFRVVNEERGMLGFTGTFQGKPLSVQSTGMGCPSAGIVFEELVMLGVKRLVRVGTCGGLRDGMTMGDTVIGLSATAEDTTPLRYAQMNAYAPCATFSLAAEAVRQSEEQGATVPGRHERGLLRPRQGHLRPLEAHRTCRRRDGGGDDVHRRRGARH